MASRRFSHEGSISADVALRGTLRPYRGNSPMNPEIVRALAILEADPDNADALASLAQLTEGGGNGHGRGAPREESGADTAVRRALGEARRVHRDRGDFELVVRLIDLELGIETDKSRRADLYYEKGKLLADELLREDEAVRAFERVLELRPDDEGTQDTLGHISLVRDNWQKIVKKYLEEAKGSTDRQLTTSLYLSVAEIYAKYQPDDNVEKYLKKALEVEPRNLKASLRLERIYRGEQTLGGARRALRAAHRGGRDQGRARRRPTWRSPSCRPRSSGKRNEASESYKKALGLDPANQRALSALVDVLHGRGELAGAHPRLRERAAGAPARRARDGDVPADRHAVVEEARQPRSGRRVLEEGAQGRAGAPGDARLLPRLLRPRRARRRHQAARGARPGAEGRARRQAARSSSASRWRMLAEKSSGAAREGDRSVEGRPQAGPGAAATPSRRSSASIRRPRSGTRCSSCSRRRSRRCPRTTSTGAWRGCSRWSRSIATS